MKINFKQKIKNFDDTDAVDESGKQVTLDVVCINALMSNNPEERVSGDEKLKRYDLALKIKNSNELNLSSEDITLLKKLIGNVYSTLIVGQSYKMLEGEVK